MYSSHQRLQNRACRLVALEQNQRLFQHARDLSALAYALLESAQLDSETFEQYRRLRDKAEEKFREAIEHLCLVNRDFADSQPPVPSAQADDKEPLFAKRAILRNTGR